MRRSIALIAALVALALPQVAAAQTPSVTPTPAPVMFTFRFDCAIVPWSCGEKPTDIRWQLWRGTKCQPSQQKCTWDFERLVTPNEPIPIDRGNVRLFLGPISSRANLVDRCNESPGGDSGKVRLTIFSWCSVNEKACAGPENWNVYGVVDGKLTHLYKHIGDCTGMALGNSRHGEIITMDWGLPGALSSAPTSAATMTPPPLATLTPTVGIPTDVPTVAATPTASPTATDAPSATRIARPTDSPDPTATPMRAVLLLPMLWR